MTQIESRYWMWHLVILLFWPLVLLWYGFDVAVLEPNGLTALGQSLMIPYSLLTLVAIFGSLIGYPVEARQLEAAGSEWVPTPWKWILMHFIFSPMLTAPAYFFERHHNIGVNWGEIPVVGGRLHRTNVP